VVFLLSDKRKHEQTPPRPRDAEYKKILVLNVGPTAPAFEPRTTESPAVRALSDAAIHYSFANVRFIQFHAY
jgi:hypothetical protein